MPRILSLGLMALAGVALASPTLARPISYAGGHMLMVEHEPDVDRFSYTYSPSHRWSVSAGGVRADGLQRTDELELGYVRTSRLLHRWNLPAAQANAFVWGGVGQGHTALGDGLARHGQAVAQRGGGSGTVGEQQVEHPASGWVPDRGPEIVVDSSAHDVGTNPLV